MFKAIKERQQSITWTENLCFFLQQYVKQLFNEDTDTKGYMYNK